MTSTTRLSLVTLLIVLDISCSTDLPIPNNTQSISPATYTPMTVGSYWVYDWYVTDNLGNDLPMNITDSLAIIGDTVYGGDTFAIWLGTWRGNAQQTWWLRDSSGYLISPSGRIYFSASNYTDTLYTWYSATSGQYGYLLMCELNDTVSVPAGTFTTTNARYTVMNTTGSWPCFGIYDHHDSQYALSVGKVRSSFPQTTSPICRTEEQRLRAYHIQ